MKAKSICVQRGEFVDHFVAAQSADGSTTIDAKIA
jgi:hypothetical protein